MKYQKENAVIQKLGQELIRFVDRKFGHDITIAEKTAAYDVASTIDMGADRLITQTLKKNFPADTLRTEESSPAAELGSGRTWVVDPICGSMNVVRGIRFFCSNIALVENGRVVAAWVVDHSRRRVLWSVGSGLFDGRQRLERLGKKPVHSVVDIDWGYFYRLPKRIQKAYGQLDADIRLKAGFEGVEFSSSLSFASVATNQLQGAIMIDINSWDLAASAFLVGANGGIVSNYDGSAWNLESRSLVMASHRSIHTVLLRLIRKNHLEKIK